jgi:hypothetical protein
MLDDILFYFLSKVLILKKVRKKDLLKKQIYFL